jgi:hypothetical protein
VRLAEPGLGEKIWAEHDSDSTPSSTGASNTDSPAPLAFAFAFAGPPPTAANIAGPLRRPDVICIDVSDEEGDVGGAVGGMQGRGVVPR